MDSPKKTSHLLAEHADLKFIFTKAKKIAHLQEKFLPYIDAHLRRYCQVANMVNNVLTVITDNASIATFLRFKQIELLASFKQDAEFKLIREIIIKVRPKQTPFSSVDKIKPMARLSPATAQALETIAESISDPKLRQALLNLAKNI